MRKSVSFGIMLFLVTFFCVVCVNAAPVLNPANGHYYDIITGQHGITWIQANSAAQSLTYNDLPGHLVTITSQVEQDFINANFGSNFAHSNYFLGGIQPPGSPEPAGGWTWVTGEPWSYTNWEPDSPGNGYGGDDGIHPQGYPENAIETYHANGDWNDFPSDVSEYGRDGYIVEWDTANQPPVANAGPDQTGKVGTLVTLDGTGSSDPDNNLPLTYEWTMSAPPGSIATLSSTTAVNPTFKPDKFGPYVITLTVKDNLELQSTVSDSVTIAVTNQPPVAAFITSTPPLTIRIPITLDASSSYDPNNDPLTYSWKVTAPDGYPISTSSPTGKVTTFTPDLTGVYFVELTVNDGVLSDIETKDLTVMPLGQLPVAAFKWTPKKPDRNDAVTFDAKASKAAEGRYIVNYNYKIVNKIDAKREFNTLTRTLPGIIFWRPGPHWVTLVVRDNTGAQSEPVTQIINVNELSWLEKNPKEAALVNQAATVLIDSTGYGNVVTYGELIKWVKHPTTIEDFVDKVTGLIPGQDLTKLIKLLTEYLISGGGGK
jgi:hypothetical protein